MPGTTRLPRAARRAQLVEAAAGAFLERGFDGTSMDDVAQAAGVSRLIVYRIFDSKQDLYRAVLLEVLEDLGRQFGGAELDEIRQRGATYLVLPVARAHPDAFRLLWRRAWHEPEFAHLALQFRRQVTYYARENLRHHIDDPVILQWAARSAGAHLIEGLCNWIDEGDPARDDELAATMAAGLRALTASWGGGPS